MNKPAGNITDFSVTYTVLGYNSIGNATPTVTRKSLYDITYDESVIASVIALPIYQIFPTPISVTITNSGGAAEAPRATFENSVLTFTAPGSIKLEMIFSIAGGQRYGVTRTMSSSVTTQASTTRALVSYNAGSLAKHVSDSCTALMTGDPQIRRQLYSNYDITTLSFGRNASCFLAGVGGLEAYPVGNNGGAFRMNGVAISRRHILSVAHIGSQLNQTLYFLRGDGSVIQRTVIDYLPLVISGSDQTVALLDTQLPADFDLPHIFTGLHAYLPEYATTNGSPNSDISYSALRRVPIISFNQDFFPAVNYLSGSDYSDTAKALYYSPVSGQTATVWQQKPRGGDSGSPVFLLINNRLCVLGSQQNYDGGLCVGDTGSLESTMNLLCSRNSFSNESVTYADLSAFNEYP